MERDVIVDPPAVVRPAEDLGELAPLANAGFDAGEDAARQGVKHYIAAGEALVKAKALCGHGKWLTWAEKNLRFGLRQAQRLMQLYHERDQLKYDMTSYLTIESAAQALARHDADDASSASCLLAPGHVYFCAGTDTGGGQAWAEIAALPDAPDYCVFAFAFDRGRYSDYCGRGILLAAVGVANLAEYRGFVPGPDGWQERPYDASSPPMAVVLDLLDRRQCTGRYEWCAEMPAESSDALVQEAMARWGITEEPRENGATRLNGRRSHGGRGR
jgi:Protein of unknown function (DUF3102)